MGEQDITSISSSVAATRFEDFNAVYGERKLFGSWDDALIELYEGDKGLLRFWWNVRDRKFTKQEDDPGDLSVLYVNLEHEDAQWLAKQLAEGRAHVRPYPGRALVPINKSEARSLASRLGKAVLEFDTVGVPLTASKSPFSSGPLVAIPPPKPHMSAEEFVAGCRERRRLRLAQEEADAAAAAAARPSDTSVAAVTKGQGQSTTTRPLHELAGKVGKESRGRPARADSAETDPAWSVMLPSMVIRPLALIMAGQCTLHGDEVRHDDRVLGHFDGTRSEFEHLTGATAHKVFRHLILSQQTGNHGELVGGVAGLAVTCRVQNKRAKLALDAFARLRLGQRELVLRVADKSRPLANGKRALPFELRGPLASGYFSNNRTVNIDSGSRRLVPLLSTPLPTTSNDRAAAEMSLELLIFLWMREKGHYDDTAVAAPIAEWELARLAASAGLSLAHVQSKLLDAAWSDQLSLLECPGDDAVYVGFFAESAPEAFAAFKTGLFRTARARENRRRAGRAR